MTFTLNICQCLAEFLKKKLTITYGDIPMLGFVIDCKFKTETMMDFFSILFYLKKALTQCLKPVLLWQFFHNS